MTKKFITKMVAVFLGMFAAVSVFGQAQAEVVYYRGNGGEPQTMDPQLTSVNVDINITQDLYEGLVTTDAAAHIIPGAAASWDVSDDRKVYTFHLRDDGKWSNGQPVTAGDFLFSFRRMMDPATASTRADLVYNIKNAEAVNKGSLKTSALGVSVIDDRTLRIELKRPSFHFIDYVQNVFPVYPPSIKKHGKGFTKPGNMISNGAYVLAEHVPSSHVTVVKNPHFHDAANVAIDKVIFYPIEDTAAALRRFVAGELDSNEGAPLEQLAWIREHLGHQLRVSTQAANYYYAFDTRHPPFNDRRVRRALSMVIDRHFLADKIFAGTRFAGYSAVPPGLDHYGTPAELDYKDDDMLDRQDTALALMKEAGYGPDHPLEITLRYNTNDQHKQAAVAIANMWKPLGVKTELINTDVATHYGRLSHGASFDVARAGWVGDHFSQAFLMTMISDASYNYSHWSNPEYDRLYDQALEADTLEQHNALLKRAEAVLVHDEPNAYLLYYASTDLVSDKVKGWVGNLMGSHPSRFISIQN